MSEELTITRNAPLVIGATGMEALAQNIRVIILTAAYSVPLDRAFAHLADMIDSPAPQETARLTALLVEAIELHEPRVRVERLDWVRPADCATALMQGRLTPRITFSVRARQLTATARG